MQTAQSPTLSSVGMVRLTTLQWTALGKHALLAVEDALDAQLGMSCVQTWRAAQLGAMNLGAHASVWEHHQNPDVLSTMVIAPRA